MTDPPPRTPPSGQTTPISPAGVVSPVNDSVQDTGRDDGDPADELPGIPVARPVRIRRAGAGRPGVASGE